MRELRCFVQFIHPGGEHSPDEGDLKLWNRVAHRRKFVKSRGRYRVGEHLMEGEICFWGEWEPESRVARRYANPPPDHPRFLYEPYYVDHGDTVRRQNTDPFVFGEAFHYTGCMQHTQRGPTQLRYLGPGSLVLFGSCRGMSRFVLDTALVVAHFMDHTATDHNRRLEGRISNTYRAVTIDPWYRGSLPKGQSYRLYVGATLDRPVCGMFSFFPCQPHANDGKAFARPEIRIPGLITSHLTQGKKIARDLTVQELADLWKEVTEQVEGQGLCLGVHAELPPERREGGVHVEHADSTRKC